VKDYPPNSRRFLILFAIIFPKDRGWRGICEKQNTISRQGPKDAKKIEMNQKGEIIRDFFTADI